MVESKTHNLDNIFHALSDPTRRAILRKLSTRERVITEVAEPFNMSLAAVSKHIKVLEQAQLVHRRREGSFSYLSLNAQGMVTADKWIAYYRKYWEGQLSSLKRFMEEENK